MVEIVYTERDSTGRMKLLLEVWHGDLDRRRRGRRRRRRERKKDRLKDRLREKENKPRRRKDTP